MPYMLRYFKDAVLVRKPLSNSKQIKLINYKASRESQISENKKTTIRITMTLIMVTIPLRRREKVRKLLKRKSGKRKTST